MEPVATEMRAALEKIDMKAPLVPLISNRTAAPMTDVEEIKEALVYQITHGVRWRETILTLPSLGARDNRGWTGRNFDRPYTKNSSRAGSKKIRGIKWHIDMKTITEEKN